MDKMSVIDEGMDFYAPQTVELPDGRIILIGWMQDWDNYLTPESFRWSGMMTVPREVTLCDNHLCQFPVREIKNYYTNHMEWKNVGIGQDSFRSSGSSTV